MRAIVKALFDAFGADPANQPHADALMPSLLPLYQMLDPDTYGGAVMLGVDGVCIISHGSSGATAINNALHVARDMAEGDIVAELRQAITIP